MSNTDSCSRITFTVDGVPHAYTVDDWYVGGCDDGLFEGGVDAGDASTGLRGGATAPRILLLKDTEAYVELGDNGDTFHHISGNKRSTTPIHDVQIDM